MPKKKYIPEFDIGERVFFITDEADELPAIITEIKFTTELAYYLVNRGFEEKWCQALEIKEAKADA